MKKLLNLIELAALGYKEAVETDTCFLINMFGKYRPNLCYVIDKKQRVDRNGNAKPFRWIKDDDYVRSMNIPFDSQGTIEFLYGDYYKSKKGTNCFRLKEPKESKHLLLAYHWGGCFNSSSPVSAESVHGCLYHRTAGSNGGGVGTTYIVVPCGYKNHIHDDEVDGTVVTPPAFAEREAEFGCKHQAELDAFYQKEADIAAEIAYYEAHYEEIRESFRKRIDAIDNIFENWPEKLNPIKIKWGEKSFCRGCGEDHKYTEENLSKMETRVRKDLEEALEKEKIIKIEDTFDEKHFGDGKIRAELESLGCELILKSEVNRGTAWPWYAINLEGHFSGRRAYDRTEDDFWKLVEEIKKEKQRRIKEAEEAAIREVEAANEARLVTLFNELGVPNELRKPIAELAGTEASNEAVKALVEAVYSARGIIKSH